MAERCDLVVIGAGPAGLSHAFWTLREDPERKVVVLEAADRPGGWVRTERVDGFSLELGPQGLRPSDSLDALVEALGMQQDVVPAAESAKIRRVGRNGTLHAVPTGPGAFLKTKLLPFGSKLRIFKEPFVRRPATPDPEESVSSFVGRRFGAKTVPLVQAVVSGIFAGDADTLEVASAFPMLADAERDHGSVFKGFKAKARAARAARGGAPRPKRPALVTFTDGMRTLTDRLARVLGDRLVLSAPAVRVERSGEGYRITFGDGSELDAARVVCACPARETAKLVEPLDAELARELAAVPFASLTSVYLDLEAAQATDAMRGFGFLLEPSEESPVLGGLSCSDIFPSHAPEGRFLVRVMMGGARFPELVDDGDDALVQLAEETFRRYTGYAGDSRVIRVARVREAIPQYDKGHGARLERVRAQLEAEHPGLLLRGNSYRAIAVTGQLGEPTGDPV